MQAFLIAAECGLIASTAALLRALGVRDIRALLLVGISCNPVCILLVVQHGNFDVLVGWTVVLLLLFLGRFDAAGQPVDWLLACLFLGIGIGLKTVPLVLSPLLLYNVRRLSRSERALGAVLAFGLPLYALSVVYALAPASVTKWVLGYRSLGGWFGVSGLLHFLRRDEWLPAFARLFALGMAGAIIVVAIQVLRRRISGTVPLVLTALLLLSVIPFVGPGYGPQYIFWFWPLVLVSYATGSSRLRAILVGFGAVAAATYLFEYALIEAQGAFWLYQFNDQTASLLALLLRTNKVKTLLRAPLFLAYASMLAGGTLELRGRMAGEAAKA